MSLFLRFRTVAILILVAVLVVAAVYLSLRSLAPPPAVAETAAAEQFSAERAAKHLREISREPHPTGSAANMRVRDYIFSRLGQMGLQPELQREFISAPPFLSLPWRGAVAGTIENIVARMEGTEGKAAVLLVAHYDSVAGSPGAGDDGHAVAALLETARALKASPAPQNDIIFLFTDGEEPGLLGARAFVERHPWAKEVAMVLNFEARGTSGPVAMFETGAVNYEVVSAFAAAAPRPLAYSVIYDLYRLLPNDTDLSVFKNAGYQGLNFACAHNAQNYHTALDNMDNMDLRTLQHTGSYALALAAAFGDLDLNTLESDAEAAYFTLLPAVLVCYPLGWNLPLTAAALLLLAAALVAGLLFRVLKPGRVLLGFVIFPVTLAAVVVAVNLFWRLVKLLAPSSRALFVPAYNLYLLLGLFAFTAAVFLALYLLWQRVITPADLFAGILIFWGFLAGLTLIFLPGANYLFTWPLLFAAAGLLAVVLTKKRELSRLETAALLTLFLLPALLLVVPVLAILYMMLSLSLPEALALLLALLVSLFTPWLAAVAGRKRWALPLAGAALALLLTGEGLASAAFKPVEPVFDSIILAHDAGKGESRWISLDQQTDAFTSRFIPEPLYASQDQFLPFLEGEFLYAPAPDPALNGPEAMLVVEASTGQGRILNLKVKLPPGSELLEVYLFGAGALEVNGETLREYSGRPAGAAEAADARYRVFKYIAPPQEEFELVLHLESKDPVSLNLVCYQYGLPSFPGLDYTRPPGTVPGPESDYTVVTRAYTF